MLPNPAADGKKPRGRPCKWSFELGVDLLEPFDDDPACELTRSEMAGRCEISLRTLTEWLRRGRAGEQPYAWFAKDWDGAERRRRRLLFARSLIPLMQRERESWQRFREGREAYWRNKLGDERFFERRLAWLIDKGKAAAARRLISQLESEGFRVTVPPCLAD